MPPSIDKVKKPRHRHSAVQLAALNNLYEQNEHPTLGQRTALAQSLGLETKSVNAYFQNKRASSKKQPRGSPYDRPRPALPYSTIDDDYYYPPPDGAAPPAQQHQHQSQQAPHPRPRNQLLHSSDHSQSLSHPHHLEVRPSRAQIDELQRVYRANPYPTVDDLGAVAERIGMRHQTIVEWFRTQRSLDRRRVDIPPIPINPISARDSYPKPNSAPRLPSLAGLDSARRLSAITGGGEDQPSSYNAYPNPRFREPRRHGEMHLRRRSASPHYHSASPYSPASSIGGSTAGGSGRRVREDDDGWHRASTSMSTSTSTSTSNNDSYDSEPTPPSGSSSHQGHSHSSSDDEEEEAQEALTPESSPAPSSTSTSRLALAHLIHPVDKAVAVGVGVGVAQRIHTAPHTETETHGGGVPYEDALLLLGFHRRAGML